MRHFQEGQAVFVLVHGAYIGGWAWERLVRRLEDYGHTAHAPEEGRFADRLDHTSAATERSGLGTGRRRISKPGERGAGGLPARRAPSPRSLIDMGAPRPVPARQTCKERRAPLTGTGTAPSRSTTRRSARSCVDTSAVPSPRGRHPRRLPTPWPMRSVSNASGCSPQQSLLDLCVERWATIAERADPQPPEQLPASRPARNCSPKGCSHDSRRIERSVPPEDAGSRVW